MLANKDDTFIIALTDFDTLLDLDTNDKIPSKYITKLLSYIKSLTTSPKTFCLFFGNNDTSLWKFFKLRNCLEFDL